MGVHLPQQEDMEALLDTILHAWTQRPYGGIIRANWHYTAGLRLPSKKWVGKHSDMGHHDYNLKLYDLYLVATGGLVRREDTMYNSRTFLIILRVSGVPYC